MCHWVNHDLRKIKNRKILEKKLIYMWLDTDLSLMITSTCTCHFKVTEYTIISMLFHSLCNPGDDRIDSPGFNHQYCMYALIDNGTKTLLQ